MTDAERIALLKKVARVAPREMLCSVRAAALVGDYAIMAYRSGDTLIQAELSFKSDGEDSIAIMSMLDAMEGAGWFPRIGNNPYGQYWCSVYDHDPREPKMKTIGSTRAEAVARAFVQVFGGKE